MYQKTGTRRVTLAMERSYFTGGFEDEYGENRLSIRWN